jgi:large subunit ribosomal protein L4
MEVAVLKYSGESTSKKVNLSEEIFGIEPNDHAIYLDVKSFLANQRRAQASLNSATKFLVRLKN